MRTITGKYSDGSAMYVAFPTSNKDLKVLFLMAGIHAWPVKFGGKIHILYPAPLEQGGPVFYNTQCNGIQDMSLKQWLEIGEKNCPPENKAEPYSDELQRWFKWPAINKHLQLSTQ